MHAEVHSDITSTQKTTMRRAMRATLRDMRPPLPDVATPIAAWLGERPELQCITLFAPLAEEPDLMPLLRLFPDRIWCFPRVLNGRQLAFHEVKDVATDLRPATLGILEPTGATPQIPIDRIDAFICPGLAFDLCGGRLGRGRGYYDRMLAGARADAVKIGACFACQLVDSTFPEDHDVRMDLVISELGPSILKA